MEEKNFWMCTQPAHKSETIYYIYSLQWVGAAEIQNSMNSNTNY
jgi:hypothetical protein